MVERLERCEDCKNKANCEFFNPRKTCFINSEITREIYGYPGLRVKQMELNSALQRRTDWGGNRKKRLKNLAKETAEFFKEIQEIKEEEECLKTSND